MTVSYGDGLHSGFGRAAACNWRSCCVNSGRSCEKASGQQRNAPPAMNEANAMRQTLGGGWASAASGAAKNRTATTPESLVSVGLTTMSLLLLPIFPVAHT